MMERALETLGRDDVKVNSLAPFMKEYHQRAGDYLERATGYARQGIRHPFRVTRVVMTDEESYTCEYCNRKFETIGAWRRHDGSEPKKRGEAGRHGGDGPVPEEEVAGPTTACCIRCPIHVTGAADGPGLSVSDEDQATNPPAERGTRAGEGRVRQNSVDIAPRQRGA